MSRIPTHTQKKFSIAPSVYLVMTFQEVTVITHTHSVDLSEEKKSSENDGFVVFKST